MWSSGLVLILIVSLGESGYDDWHTPPRTGQPRPIGADDFSAFDIAARDITARHGSQRPVEPKRVGTIEFGALGGLSGDDLRRQLSSDMSEFPGARFSVRGVNGQVVRGSGARDPVPYNSEPDPREYREPPRTALPPFRNPLPSSPSRNYDRPPPSDDLSSLHGMASVRPDFRDEGMTPNNNHDQWAQPQYDESRQPPQQNPPPRGPRLDRAPSRNGPGFPGDQAGPTHTIPGNDRHTPSPEDYQENEHGGGYGDNPVSSLLGSTLGLGRGGTQNQQPDEESHGDDGAGGFFGGGGLGGGERKPKVQPVTTFNPTDGRQAADNLASAIAGEFDYRYSNHIPIGGATEYFLDLCEQVVAKQGPALTLMKQSDRTLMDIMQLWKQNLATKLYNFYVIKAKQPDYEIGGDPMNSLLRMFSECVRPKLVLLRV